MISRAHKDILELAVIWNPARRLLATTKRGDGTLLNGNVVHLEKMETSDKPMVVERDNQEQVQSIGYSVTNLGASANALLALSGEGRAFVSSNGFIWDFAPPILLLAEAGWHVTDIHGQPFRWTGKIEKGRPGVIAAPLELHQILLKALH